MAPALPDDITDMAALFGYCTSLKSYAGSTDPDGDFSGYKIPDSTKMMEDAFNSCKGMTKAPTIPKNVISMGPSGNYLYTGFPSGTFEHCTNLTGTLICNANPSEYCMALYGTKITAIEGNCSEKTKQALLITKNPPAKENG